MYFENRLCIHVIYPTLKYTNFFIKNRLMLKRILILVKKRDLAILLVGRHTMIIKKDINKTKFVIKKNCKKGFLLFFY